MSCLGIIQKLNLDKIPKGTEKLSEEELSMLVTRDSLLGAGDPLPADRLPEVKDAIMEKGDLLSFP